MTEQYLTPAEVAAELRTDLHTVYRWMRSGKLPHLDLGYRTKRVTREDLDEFKTSRYVTGGE